ncbi:MAG: PHP domain-containing protein [Kiritimatiellia bacterium]|jgi:hypothetical protein
MNEQEHIAKLNAPTSSERLDALRAWVEERRAAGCERPVRGRDVNNHIHTIYSFSPYSPTKAVWMASEAGLATAGIMDHDSIAGAREFIEAGRILGFPTTIGAECRASFAATPLAGRRINNPDQETVAYIALHGVPHSRIDALASFFEPIRQARARRNRDMTVRLNALLEPAGITLDYEADIVPVSSWADGGEVTERHLLFVVASQLLKRFGAGESLVRFLRETLRTAVSAKAEAQLLDAENPHVAYDLLGVLKSDLVEKFYVSATDECPPIADVVAFARENGIVLAYPYLGDVGNSVTGDKKAQTFEDSYLDELFHVLKKTGFDAVTYMPSRNTRDQLVRLRALCDCHGFFQISGEDINQPRQAFICEAMRDPFFANLYDSAWALIGHELLATESLAEGMFSPETLARTPLLDARIAYFRDAALNLHSA